MIVEVPHAGLQMDPESLSYCSAIARSIGRDADLLVDQLFDSSPRWGATFLVAEFSRYVCDLNRAPDDYDQQTSTSGRPEPSPHGVIWRKSTEGRAALAHPLPASEVERRLRLYYHPYHQKLQELIAEKHTKFGYVILLCAHSMPSFGRLGEHRADVVPGTRGRKSADGRVIGTVDEVAREFAFSVLHDNPYQGGFTTSHYGRPDRGVHAVQVELARRLYMDEMGLRPHVGFDACQAFCEELVRRLGAVRPASFSEASTFEAQL